MADLMNIDISGDITIRESGYGSWYIFDWVSDFEIEVTDEELNKIVLQSELGKQLLEASKLALTELDRIGSDIGFEPDRYQERINALDALSRVTRKAGDNNG